jgi:hypothetical protein
MMPATLERARAAKLKLRERLGKFPELRGIGIAALDGGYGVKVNVSRIPLSPEIPDDVDGTPVIVDVVGDIRPL